MRYGFVGTEWFLMTWWHRWFLDVNHFIGVRISFVVVDCIDCCWRLS